MSVAPVSARVHGAVRRGARRERWSYGWGHLYKDDYVWATVSSYASRFRPDLGYIEYCSREYDVASWHTCGTC